ncbi:hypothetical protein HMI54_015105 [Coelomomyces lativittatus]|nr:hypothetical protein HMI54_015105 [Coelomomyces lativittatus]KAJ1515970.1 hypothetical protein HMI56_002305 [Coelomomyces lativittatus]
MSSLSSSLTEKLALGLKVRTNAGIGIIRFLGETKFSNGIWVGVELDEATGKNDGEVKGIRYFTTTMNHGLFVRPSLVSPLSEPSILPTGNVFDTSKPESPSSSNVSTTQNSNDKFDIQKSSSDTAPPISEDLPIPVADPTRKSTFSIDKFISPMTVPESPLSSSLSQPSIISSPSPNQSDAKLNHPLKIDLAPIIPFNESDFTYQKNLTQLSIGNLPVEVEKSFEERIENQSDIINSTMKDQIKILKDESSSHIDKLQEKLLALQQETRDLRKELKFFRESKDDFEAKYIETLDALELVTLDKEMAEEKLETMHSELDALNEKLLSVVQEKERDEDHFNIHQPDCDKNWQEEYQQLLRQNDRFKDALIKLKDAKEELEHDLTHRIRILETELNHASYAKEQLSIARDRISNLESNIEEFREKLEDALGLEDLVEQLTDNNLRYKEKIEVMEQHIQDLESLKEINEALEHSHLEVQKDFQQELDLKNVHIINLESTLEEHQQSIQRYEFNLQHLRTKIIMLQEQLKATEEIKASSFNPGTANESRENENMSPIDRHPSLIQLKTKLQQQNLQLCSISTQSSLNLLNAQQAQEQLNLWMCYLPTQIINQELPAFHSILLLKRLLFKINLITETFKPGLPLETNVSLMTFIQLLQSLKHCLQPMLNQICTCDESEFLTYATSLPTLFPLDKELDDFIQFFGFEEDEVKKAALKLQTILQHLIEPLEVYVDGLHSVSAEVAVSLHARMWNKVYHYIEKNMKFDHHIRQILSREMKIDPQSQTASPLHLFFNNETMTFWSQLNTLTSKVHREISNCTKDAILFLKLPVPFQSPNPLIKFLHTWSLFLEQIFLNFQSYSEDVQNSWSDYSQEHLNRVARFHFPALFQDKGELSESQLNIHSLLNDLFKEIQMAESLYYQCFSAATGSSPLSTPPWISRGKKFQLSEKNKYMFQEEKWKDLQSQLHHAALTIKEKENSIDQLTLKCQLMESRLPSKLEEQKISAASQLDTLSKKLHQCLTELSDHQNLIQRLQQENLNLTTSIQMQSGKELSYLRQALHLLRIENANLRASPLVEKLKMFRPLFNHPSITTQSHYHQQWQTLSRRARELAASPRLVPVVQGWRPRKTTPFQRHLVHARMLQQKTAILESQVHQALVTHQHISQNTFKASHLVVTIKLPVLPNLRVLASPVQCHISAPEQLRKIHEMLLNIRND